MAIKNRKQLDEIKEHEKKYLEDIQKRMMNENVKKRIRSISQSQIK